MFKYKKNKHTLKLKKSKFSNLMIEKKNLKFTFKKLFTLNNKINFFKKFTLYTIKKKKIFYKKLSICMFSAKYKANLNKFSLKKNEAKFFLTHNYIPNVIKKFK